MLMAEMEEKLSGEYLFDRHFIDTNVKTTSDNALNMIKHLNDMSGNKYTGLFIQYKEINKKIKNILSHRLEIPVTALTIPIKDLTADMTNIAGGKMAHIGEIVNRLNMPVPDGFAITAYAFKKFLEHSSFSEKINEKLSILNITNMEELNRISREIQDMVIVAEIPDDLQNAIKESVERLRLKVKVENTPHPNPLPQGEREVTGVSLPQMERGPYLISPPLTGGDEGGGATDVLVSVRSSAIQENGDFSFAGQYATFLNVPENLIINKYKEVVASMFTPRAIFYYKTKGFSEEEMIMAVGVLGMVNAKAAGVLYTKDPNNPEIDRIIINAAYGLGKLVVEGDITPDMYTVSRRPEGSIIEKKISEQEVMLIGNDNGTTKMTEVPEDMRGKQCISDELIKMLSQYAVMIEKHYGAPQDIEWAVDKDNKLFILQARPLRIFKIQNSKFKIPRKVEGYNILLDRGVIVCKGIGYGKAFILKDEEELKNFPEGHVLVARNTSTKFVTIMNKASAIVTDVGSSAGHLASLAKEYNVPTIIDTELATTLLKEGQEITVDAINCNIYEGRVNELLEYTSKPKEPFKDTHLFKILQKALKFIVPLNLIDPDSENFAPKYCKTFHDIIRFAHEMSKQEMFAIGQGHDIEGLKPVELKADIPVGIYIIDMDGCIKGNSKKALPEDIESIPFSAFLRGLKSMRWPKSKPAVKGFHGTAVRPVSISEDQLIGAGQKSFAIISKNYMNFSIRLGYHFSMVEAYASDVINNNYIKFFFKGGGVAIDKKMRRVRLIKEILKKLHFNVNVSEDVIDAVMNKYKQPSIESTLETIGRLAVYTKQLDMALYNDAITDMFIEDFVKGYIKE